MLRWFMSFFPDFEDEKVIFKIKVKKGNQQYSAICWYKVYGYWKYSWELFYTPLGIICQKDDYGKWRDSMRSQMLDLCEEIFVSNARKGIESRYTNKKVVSMSKLMPRIDNP